MIKRRTFLKTSVELFCCCLLACLFIGVVGCFVCLFVCFVRYYKYYAYNRPIYSCIKLHTRFTSCKTLLFHKVDYFANWTSILFIYSRTCIISMQSQTNRRERPHYIPTHFCYMNYDTYLKNSDTRFNLSLDN